MDEPESITDYPVETVTPKEHLAKGSKEIPQYNKVSIRFPHPSAVDEKNFEADEEQLSNYHYSLIWMRWLLPRDGINRAVGEYMYAIFEMEVNENPVPLMQLFWRLVGSNVSEDIFKE